jgi:hypothetical protein
LPSEKSPFPHLLLFAGSARAALNACFTRRRPISARIINEHVWSAKTGDEYRLVWVCLAAVNGNHPSIN